jgi:hypothetical protein
MLSGKHLSDISTSEGHQPVAAPAAGFSVGSSFLRLMRDSVRHYGVMRTAREVVSAIYRLLRDRLPDRRRTHYGDLDFDFERNVDTTRANVGFHTQLMAALTGHEYFATDPWLFEQIMQALPIRFEDFTFIDLGSGKGRSLMLASDYPFRRIVGVEYLPELHRAAQLNIGRYSGEGQKCRQLESICQDARDFEFPNEPTVLYLFNPFPEPVFALVLQKLKESLKKNPRPSYVAYRYPEYKRVIDECEWLERIAETEQWVIYSYRERER